jgi:hypothetical protein
MGRVAYLRAAMNARRGEILERCAKSQEKMSAKTIAERTGGLKTCLLDDAHPCTNEMKSAPRSAAAAAADFINSLRHSSINGHLYILYASAFYIP